MTIVYHQAVKLIVSLKAGDTEHKLRDNRERRPTCDQVRALCEENADRIRACIEMVRGVLPGGTRFEPLPNLNMIVVDFPAPVDVASTQDAIRSASPDVESVIGDFPMKTID